jgi:diguanylate cyclase (GGDEF)-like protein
MMCLLLVVAVAAAAGVRIAILHGRLRTLEEQAITDPLTGAFNRRHMDSRLAAAIDRRTRTGERASLILFDVDRFKDINDAVGHVEGDRVLKGLVTLVAQRQRKLDALFRVGGEEFALLLAGARFSDALHVAEDLRAQVAQSGLAGARQVSISAGVSELRPGQCARDWVEEVDAALYHAKRAGRNRVAGRCAGPALSTCERTIEKRVRVPLSIS